MIGVNRSSLWRLRIALALGVMVLRIPSLSEPAWYSDDGFFMSVAWLSSRGLRLYADVYDNSPPGIYWLYRLMLLLGARDHHVVVQAFASAAVVIATVLTFEVARRLTALWPALLSASVAGVVLSMPVLDGDLFNVEIAGLPFFMVALLLAFGRGWASAAAAGALLGIAITFRPSFLVDGLAVLAVLLMSSRVTLRVASAAAGLGAVGFLVVIGMWAGGSLQAYFDSVAPAEHAYLVWANGGNLTPLFVRLACLALVGAFFHYRSGTTSGRVLAVWIPAALAGASLTPRELTHYVHEAVPALAVGVSVLAARISWKPVAAAASLAAVVLAAEAVLILPAQETARIQGYVAPPPFLHNYGYAGMVAYYGNWLDMVSGAKSVAAYDAWFPGQASSDGAELARLRQMGTSSSTRIIVIGDRPWLYVKGDVLPATPFLATNSSFWRVAWAPGVVSHALAAGCADFVVYVDAGNQDWSAALNASAYEEIGGTPWPTYRPLIRSSSCADR